jgi:uncharacterized protein (UPF0332 family)
MTLSQEEKDSLSKYRIEKAKKILEDARLLLEERRFESSVNRSYYAALTAAKAVLIIFGIDPKTHEGVTTMLGKNLILPGHASSEYGKWFRTLKGEREDVDYADYVSIDKAEAEAAFRSAERFVEQSVRLAEKLRKELFAPSDPQ